MFKKFFVLVFLFVSVVFAFYPNNAFKAFFWTQGENDSLKHGCYGYAQIDSILTSPSVSKLSSLLWLTYEWWFIRFKTSYVPTEITIHNTKPDAIVRCPNHFDNVEWFTGFSRTNSSDSIKFYFPLLPLGQNYGRYDYFTVDVDSLLDLEFYGAGDSIMVGTFVHKQPDARGAVNILGRNAVIVELTNANPFRIKSVRCNGDFDSLLTIFLKFDLSSLKQGAKWYGIDLLDTITHMSKIKVYAVDLEEPHTIGSNKNITWKLEGHNEIDSCLVSVSYDEMSWLPLGKTELDSMLNWTIPVQASNSTIIKVIACGKHGERVVSTKTDINFYFLNVLNGLRLLY